MNIIVSRKVSHKFMLQVVIGFAAGIVIAAIDNIAFNGEVSPVVIVVLLFAVSFTSGVLWGIRGWLMPAIAWICVPSVHLDKHIIGLPDTIHPNTYGSILMLAMFTLVIALAGISIAALVRKLVASAEDTGSV